MMAKDLATLTADGIELSLDLTVGHIATFRVKAGDRVVTPLHRAPWCDDAADALPQDIAPGLARLSGDFFCAPFSANDIEPAPTHGWTANSRWSVLSLGQTAEGFSGRFRLERPVMGASVEKKLRLIHGHPFLYQEHRITGGSGRLPVAHHTMTRMARSGQLAFSRKRCAIAPPSAREGGSVLRYPSISPDLHAVPLAAGGITDLHRYPIADRHEDFVILVEDDHPGPGWTAVTREQEQDLILVLKDPATLPVTMLWYSHGARDHAPWSGRHAGVLGIEDGRSAIGHRQSISPNVLSEMKVPTYVELEPDRTTVIRQVIGAAPLEQFQEKWKPAFRPELRKNRGMESFRDSKKNGNAPESSRIVRDLRPGTGCLTVLLEGGDFLELPFDDTFLAGAPASGIKG